MVDPGDLPESRHYVVESRLNELVRDQHIDKTKIEDVLHQTIWWNVIMVALSAGLCLLGMLPYVFLNVKVGSSLPSRIRWTFPALRVAGGFLTTIMMQIIIQKRITTLSRRWISQHCSPAQSSRNTAGARGSDIEKGSKCGA